MNPHRPFVVHFGIGGSAEAYSKNSGKTPDVYVDNDRKFWGKTIRGTPVLSPTTLVDLPFTEIVITSGYVQEIRLQLSDLGISEDLITIPTKVDLSHRRFKTHEQRSSALEALDSFLCGIETLPIVTQGGTALGLVRDGDLIAWDDDIDLAASVTETTKIMEHLQQLGADPYLDKGRERTMIKAHLPTSRGDRIPLGISQYDPALDIFVDCFESFRWEWPIEMYLDPLVIGVGGRSFFVPSSTSHYLSTVYGTEWNTPNPQFGFDDYGK